MIGLSNIILEMTAKGVDLKIVIDRLCVEIQRIVPGIIPSVLTLDKDNRLHPLSAPSLPESYFHALDGLMIGPDVGSCGTAAWRREAVFVTDIAHDPRWAPFKDQALAIGLRSCWSKPVFGEHGGVIGTFALYCREARLPTAHEQAIVDVCVHLCSIILDRHERVAEREKQAVTDQLTGLGNRAGFNAALARLACDTPGSWAILIVDLDNLKLVNDGFGHHAGDLLIQAAASRIREAAAPETVFRIGGDEFALVVERAETLRDLDGFAARILQNLTPSLDCNGHAIAPKATIGSAVVAAGDLSPETVRQNADFALYHAKEMGRGGYVRYWPGIDTRIIHRIGAIRDVHAALRDGRIEAHYQPILRFDTGEVVALEALCRLRMGHGGLLAAAAFREAMADIHIASEVTRRMLELVARDLREWCQTGLSVAQVGVNVSLADFHGGLLGQQIAQAHADYGLPLDRLVIEITESAYTALRDGAVMAEIEALRSQGVRLALDDFGTGGGMLMPLLTMPVDIIKIDKALVDRLGSGEASAAVIGGLLHTARDLDVAVVAVGIESDVQTAQLRRLGCQFGQGYALSRPLDTAATARLLSAAQDAGGAAAPRLHPSTGARVAPPARQAR